MNEEIKQVDENLKIFEKDIEKIAELKKKINE